MTNENDIETCAKMLHEAFLAHAATADKMTPEEIAVSAFGFLPSNKKESYRAVAAAVLAEYAPILPPATLVDFTTSLDMVSVERVHDLLDTIDEYAMPGSRQEDLIREARTHTAVLMGIPPRSMMTMTTRPSTKPRRPSARRRMRPTSTAEAMSRMGRPADDPQ